MDILVDPRERQTLARDAQQLHRTKRLRPTAINIVQGRDTFGRPTYLTIESRKSGEWGFVQGGVEVGEDPVNAAIRELRDEVGITSKSVHILRGPLLVDQLPNTRGHEDFPEGKRYYVFHFICRDEPQIVLQESEVAKFRWYPYVAAFLFLRLLVFQSQEKLELLRRALISAQTFHLSS